MLPVETNQGAAFEGRTSAFERRLPPPPGYRATQEQLAQARRDIGDAVGLQPFKDYVRRTYGEVDEATLRAFLRKGEDTQLFGPPPLSEGKAVALSHKDSWYVDLISLPKGDPEYNHIITVQNAYTGYLYAEPLVSTTPSGENGTAAVFERIGRELSRVRRGMGGAG